MSRNVDEAMSLVESYLTCMSAEARKSVGFRFQAKLVDSAVGERHEVLGLLSGRAAKVEPVYEGKHERYGELITIAHQVCYPYANTTPTPEAKDSGYPEGQRYVVTLTHVPGDDQNYLWHVSVENHKGYVIGAEADEQRTVADAFRMAEGIIEMNLDGIASKAANPPRSVYNFLMFNDNGETICCSEAVDIEDPATLMSGLVGYLGKRYWEGVEADLRDHGAGLRLRNISDDKEDIIHNIEIVLGTVEWDTNKDSYVWSVDSPRKTVFQFSIV